MPEKRRYFITHPYFFALYPIVFLYQNNMKHLGGESLVLPSIFSLALTLFLFFTLNLLIRNKTKTGIIISLFLILFFSFGNFHEISSALLNIPQNYILLLLFLAFFIAIFILGQYLILKSKADLNSLNLILNCVSFLLLGISIIQIAIYKASPHEDAALALKNSRGLEWKVADKKPDIFYIILDGYGDLPTLKNIYDHENSPFVDYLTDKGFFVAQKSRCNYPHTHMSLSSSLNMAYINRKGDPESIKISELGGFNALIERNRVMEILKGSGYKTINISSGSELTDFNSYADENVSYLRGFDEFTTILMQTSMLKIFYFVHFNKKRLRVDKAFDYLSEDHKNGPRFVICHIFAPHPPNVFGPNGEKIWAKNFSYTKWERSKRGYISELQYLNKRLKKALDKIIKNSDVHPVIILQSDHGPAFEFEKRTAQKPTIETLRERTGILNAYYLPDRCKNMLYHSITPVNSFRIVFNCLFGEDYKILQDEIFWSSYNTEFDIKNVTNHLVK